MKTSSVLRKISPWLVCVLLFAYLFSQIPPKEFLDSFQHVRWGVFFGAGLAYFIIVFVIDGLVLRHILNRFVTDVSLREVFLVRGVSYIMMIFNYAAAQGTLAVYLKKTHKASVARSVGAVGLISAIDVLLVLTSGLLAFALSPEDVATRELSRIAKIAVPLLYAGFVVWVLFWRKLETRLSVRLKPESFFAKLLRHDLFLIFREANFKDYVFLFVSRAPLLALILAGFNGALISYQAFAPWKAVFAYNPIIMFASLVPITPAGLGTSQVLAVKFFSPTLESPLLATGKITAQSLLFSATLCWALLNQMFKAILGAFCWSQTSKEFFVDKA